MDGTVKFGIGAALFSAAVGGAILFVKKMDAETAARVALLKAQADAAQAQADLDDDTPPYVPPPAIPPYVPPAVPSSDPVDVIAAMDNDPNLFTEDKYVQFFQDINYGGARSIMMGAGSYTAATLATFRIPQDWASSIKCRGFIVDMYEHDNFGGQMVTLWSDVPDFRATSPGFNDKMSSCKIRAR